VSGLATREDGLTRSGGALAYGRSRCKGGQAPPSRTPPLVRDVRGASGAALRVRVSGLATREDGLTRSGGALAYGRSRCNARRGAPPPPPPTPPACRGLWGRPRPGALRRGIRFGDQGRRPHPLGRSPCLRPPPVQGGAGPPFQTPPACPGRSGRLRRCASRPGIRFGDQGRRTHTLGRSPCLRPLPVQRAAGGSPPPSPHPPRVPGSVGAPPARRSAAGYQVWRPGKAASPARAEPLLTAAPGARGGRPPLPDPPRLSGTFGAPPALRFASGYQVWRPGKTDSHARAEPLLTAAPGATRGGGLPPPLPPPPPRAGVCGGAPGPALCGGVSGLATREGGLTRSGGALAYGRPRCKGGQAPPSRPPPPVRDVRGASGAALRVRV